MPPKKEGPSLRYEKMPLGRPAVFLLPSEKLMRPDVSGKSAKDVVEQFLLDTYGGFTCTNGNISGYWRDERQKKDHYGEHRLYTVAFPDKKRIPELERFLARMAVILGEDCIYLETGEDAWLIYPIPPQKA